MAWPTSFDTFSGTAAQGTNLLTSPDHALDHRTLGSFAGSAEHIIGLGIGTPANNLIPVGLGGGSSAWQQTWNLGTLGTPTVVVGSDAQGDLLYRSAGGTLTRLAPGVSGQVLQTQGAAANPTWVNAVGDGLFQGDFQNYIHSGLTIGTAASLTTTAVAGTAYYLGTRYSVATDGGHTYTATRDTYVDVNPATGAFAYGTVANGATAPALTASSIRIAKAVTNAGSVTSVVQTGVDTAQIPIYPSRPTANTSQGMWTTTAANTTFTNSGQTDLVIGTVQLDRTANVMVASTIEVRGTNGDSPQFTLLNNGTVVSGLYTKYLNTAAAREMVSLPFVGVGLVAGQYIFKIQGLNSSANTVTLGNVGFGAIVIPTNS